MKCSALFDPVFERRKIHCQSDLISSLTVKVNDLSAVVESIMGELELPDACDATSVPQFIIIVCMEEKKTRWGVVQ